MPPSHQQWKKKWKTSSLVNFLPSLVKIREDENKNKRKNILFLNLIYNCASQVREVVEKPISLDREEERKKKHK